MQSLKSTLQSAFSRGPTAEIEAHEQFLQRFVLALFTFAPMNIN